MPWARRAAMGSAGAGRGGGGAWTGGAIGEGLGAGLGIALGDGLDVRVGEGCDVGIGDGLGLIGVGDGSGRTTALWPAGCVWGGGVAATAAMRIPSQTAPTPADMTLVLGFQRVNHTAPIPAGGK